MTAFTLKTENKELQTKAGPAPYIYPGRSLSIYLSPLSPLPSPGTTGPRHRRQGAPRAGPGCGSSSRWIPTCRLGLASPRVRTQVSQTQRDGCDRVGARRESRPEDDPSGATKQHDMGRGSRGVWFGCLLLVYMHVCHVRCLRGLALLVRYVLYVQIQYCLNRAGWIRTRVSGRYYSSFVVGCFSLRGQRAGSLCVYPVGCLSVELCPVLLLYTCPVPFLSMGLGLSPDGRYYYYHRANSVQTLLDPGLRSSGRTAASPRSPVLS